METKPIITSVCATHKWNQSTRIRFPGHQEHTASAFIRTSIEKEHSKTQTSHHLESLTLHWRWSCIITVMRCDTQMYQVWHGMKGVYHKEIEIISSGPRCLLRFKWRNKAVSKRSLLIFNHLNVTLRASAHICGWACRLHHFDPVFLFFFFLSASRDWCKHVL